MRIEEAAEGLINGVLAFYDKNPYKKVDPGYYEISDFDGQIRIIAETWKKFPCLGRIYTAKKAVVFLPLRLCSLRIKHLWGFLLG